MTMPIAAHEALSDALVRYRDAAAALVQAEATRDTTLIVPAQAIEQAAHDALRITAAQFLPGGIGPHITDLPAAVAAALAAHPHRSEFRIDPSA
jgi:hypothetical protein